MAQAGGSAEFYAPILAASGAYKYYVNGEWRESASGKTVAINNPCTRQAQYQVQGASRAGETATVGVHHQSSVAFLSLHATYTNTNSCSAQLGSRRCAHTCAPFVCS